MDARRVTFKAISGNATLRLDDLGPSRCMLGPSDSRLKPAYEALRQIPDFRAMLSSAAQEHSA